MKKIRIYLAPEEVTALNTITSKTKTDCWFCLDTDNEGFDCVFDLEKGYKITLRFACRLLCEAVDWMQKEDWEAIGIKQTDFAVFNNLCKNKLMLKEEIKW